MTETTESARAGAESTERAMRLIETLAVEVGPRRPTGPGERAGLERARELLAEWGVEARAESFAGYSSFAWPFGLVLLLAVLPSLLGARLRRTRSVLALAAAALLADEGRLRRPLLSRLLRRRPSANLVATIEPRGPARRTIVLMSHLDTSRSGLMFDPRYVGWVGRSVAIQSVATVLQGAGEPLLGARRSGRRLLALLRAPLLGGLGMLAERELRGQDVPGANDNASGCGVIAALAAELAEQPLAETRVIVLMTGCEESGTLGAQSFLEGRETDGWLFLNFDNVGGDCSLRYLRREGVLAKWDADPGLIEIAARVAAGRPELRLEPEDEPAGLTYDSSPVLARGGRGLTISAQDGHIPDLHWPSDTYENVDRGAIERAVTAGREIIRAVAHGEADR